MTSSEVRRVRASTGRCLAAFLVASLACAPSVAGADPTQADFATARILFNQGKDLRAKGDVRGALEKLKAAHALGQTPVTGIELARTHEQLGELFEAREICLAIARMPVASDETKKSELARKDALALADTLKPRIPTLVVRAAGLPEGAVAKVKLDGVSIPAAGLGAPRVVNPGTHDLEASFEGRVARHQVVVKEGENTEVVLTLPPAPVLPVLPPPPPEPPPKKTVVARPIPAPRPAELPGPLVLGGFAVGGVALVVGAVYGILAFTKTSKLDDSPYCEQKRCLPRAYEDIDSARNAGTIATWSFVVAAVGATVGVFGLIDEKPRKSLGTTVRPRATPWVGLGSAGVSGTF